MPMFKLEKPNKPPKPLTAWSWSRITTYEKCPQQLKFKAIDGYKEPSNAASERGIEHHGKAENFTKDKRAALPPELKKFGADFEAVRKLVVAKKAFPEMELAFDKNWKPTGWFDKDAWVRIKIDLTDREKPKHPYVIDYKTGKVRDDDYGPQLGLYAVGEMLDNPKAEDVSTRLWFLDHGVKWPRDDAYVYTRDELKDGIQYWEDRVAPMFRDTRFAPRPGWYCRYCAFARDKGGPCFYSSNN